MFLRALLLAGGWLILTEGDRSPGGLAFGALVVALALLTSSWLNPVGARRFRPVGLIRLAAAFLHGSLLGGIDVAARAFAPRLPLSPALVRYPLRLRPGAARSLFTCAASLMPGTLSTNVDGRWLLVHVLVDKRDVQAPLRALEARVAVALATALDDGSDDASDNASDDASDDAARQSDG